MTIFQQRACLFLLVTIGVLVGVANGSSMNEFKVGLLFPGLVLPSAENGSPMSIVDFRGQKVVLHIWASW